MPTLDIRLVYFLVSDPTLYPDCRNPYPGLAPMAMTVLFRERSSNLELYKLLFNVQILIDPAAISSYKHATRHMTVMRRYTKDFLETVATLTAGNPPSPVCSDLCTPHFA